MYGQALDCSFIFECALLLYFISPRFDIKMPSRKTFLSGLGFGPAGFKKEFQK